jgi:hypothetical protein
MLMTAIAGEIISVAPEGKIAGNAKTNPSTTGPQWLAISRVITVMAPLGKNRSVMAQNG